MRSFLKYTLATIVGIVIVHIFFFFILIGMIGAIASMSTTTVTIKDNTILKLSLQHAIPDKASDNPIENFDFKSLTPSKLMGLNNILKSIYQAAGGGRIAGI